MADVCHAAVCPNAVDKLIPLPNKRQSTGSSTVDDCDAVRPHAVDKLNPSAVSKIIDRFIYG